MKNKKAGTFGTAMLNTPFVVWSTAFIIIPLLFVLYYSFFDPEKGFSTEYITVFFTEPMYVKAFGISVLYSVIATVISLVIAYPFAYFLSKVKPASQRLQMVLIMLPMWMNMLLRTFSWNQILQDNGLLNKFLGLFGAETIHFLGPGAVILGMVYNYLPYMILPIYTSMSKIDRPLLEAAEDLGCNGFQKLRRVIMPLSLSGVISMQVFPPCSSNSSTWAL